MKLNRRRFLLGSATAFLATGAVTACSSSATPAGAPDAGSPAFDPAALGRIPVNKERFAHGVASGDPLADRVILWTRLAGAPADATLRWVVARDLALTDVVQSGTAAVRADRDATVKVDATGLTAGTTYYYAFAFGDAARSPTGRTRTLPNGDVARARIALTSCANYNNGFFNAYRAVARRADVDLWLHLGDSIYEYADNVYGDPAIGRALDPKHETVSLDDYRKRYALYRSDPDLQEVHRQLPLVVVWDDHEFANDAWRGGAENHQPDEGAWDARVRAASQAFLEWLPIRAGDEVLPPTIYRAFRYGDLFDLLMLDTRMAGRDRQPGSTDVINGGGKGEPSEWADPARKLLGDVQEDWLKRELTASKARGARYQILGNQVMFTTAKDPRDGTILGTDTWDGYQANRSRIVDHVRAQGIDNLVVLTGDIHTSWAFDLAPTPFDTAAYEPGTGKGSIGVEIVGPAVTSLGLETNALVDAAPSLLTGANPHLKWVEVTRKGYVIVDVTKERLQAEWYFVRDHKTRTDEEALAATFVCASGSRRLVRGEGASAARADAPALAPA